MSTTGNDRQPTRSTVRAMRPGATGHLRVNDATALPVHVAAGGAEILLVLLIDPGPLLAGVTADLLLESVSSRGLVRIRGTAVRVDSDLVRFEAEGNPEVIQRRQFVRVVAPQRVTLDDACGSVCDTRSLNISGGGMLIAGPTHGDTLEVGTEIRFSLYLGEDEPPVAGLGRVVRSANEDQRAIVFEEISKLDRERLIHFIFDRQRVALAVTRGDTV